MLKNFYILLIILLTGGSISAQKNTVKVFGLYTPFVYHSYIGSVSVGYTRDLSDNTALDISAGYLNGFNHESENYNVRVSFIPSLRLYFGSVKGRNSGMWISGFPVLGIVTSKNNHISYRAFEYGIGAAIGFRFDISKNKRWIMDMGLGASYRYSDLIYLNDDTSINPNGGLYSVVEENFDYPPSELLIPQLILQFGYKF